MKSIKSFMGRRQFLITAGVAPTLGLGLKKLSGAVYPVFHAGTAMASEGPGTSGMNLSGSRYSHLLSPIKIGNVVLKNRMLYTKALPPGIQGPETFPNDAMISYYASVAKNGAAAVTVALNKFDVTDSGIQTYLRQIADTIHFYGSKANVALTQGKEPQGYNISDMPKPDPSVRVRFEQYRLTGEGKEIPADMIQKMVEGFTEDAKLYQSLGFDMVTLYMSYRSSILSNSLSPALNKRTDKYGGSLENRARMTIELGQSIKKACGQDFLIEAQISGEEEPGGYTLDDVVEYAKLWEGSIDILQLRDVDGTASHPMGYNSQKRYPNTLHFAEAVKKSGARIITAPVGGFQDLDLNEEYIADGKTDMVAMARAFICEPGYAKKAYEGRGEDVVPCIRCNKCHTEGCSVNPRLGISQRIDKLMDPPSRPMKVAVIGGGPAGMRAALMAFERGHKVTLYEKNDYLGGQLRHADFASFQWPVKDFKDYLIRQVKKAGVNILLNTKATPEMIKEKGYDAVLVAAGAEPIIPNIPGADGSNIRTPIFVFGGEKALGKKIVVIGGDLIGIQTGMYLAENGHNVTVLTNENKLAHDAPMVHYQETMQVSCEVLKNFSYITEVTATSISEGVVTYVDDKGKEMSIQTDNVVVSAGRKPRKDEALGFYGSADRFFIIGDCDAAGTIQTSSRSAYAAATQL